MAISHVKNNAVADFTGTITGFNSQGSTTTIAATNLVRPSDWNSAHNQFYTLSGNTNNASTASGTNVVLQGVGGITLVGSTGTIGISAHPPGTATMWYPYNEALNMTVAQSNVQGTMWLAPVPTPVGAALGELHVDRIALPIFMSNATNSSGTVTVSQWFGLYTRNASTLSLQYSTSMSRAFTNSGTAGNNSLQAGIRLWTIPWTTTIQDNRYYVANIMRTTSGGGNCSISFIAVTNIGTAFQGIFGAVSSNSNQWPLGLGVYSASTSSLPASIAFSDMRGTGVADVRPPSWFMLSGTA